MNLEELSLGFGETKLTQDKTCQDLGAAIENMKSLKQFTFVGFKTEITDVGFLHLVKSLHDKKLLEKLILSFGRTKISESSSFEILP